jgi:predicted Rossmann-fold nucleotide-binding protein
MSEDGRLNGSAGAPAIPRQRLALMRTAGPARKASDRIARDRPAKKSARSSASAKLREGAHQPQDGIHDNVIATGDGAGITEAACRGAHDAGAPAIGSNIRLPHVQSPGASVDHCHVARIRRTE